MSSPYIPHPLTPERSLQQRLDALKHANDIRINRAQLKRELKAEKVSLLDVLAEPPVCAETAKVFDILIAAPKIGRVKADRMLRSNEVSPSKTVGGLTPRQRQALTSTLRERAAMGRAA